MKIISIAIVFAILAWVAFLKMAHAQYYPNDPAPIVGAPLPYAPPPPPYERYQSPQSQYNEPSPYAGQAPMYGGMFGHNYQMRH
jgi:hypothetical protein